ncbi:hypothetical protein SK128_013330 [Halocaridina rubra]|uniref:Zinc finger protein 865 n=1 Tax=Halocaridina rubra TaxID=373956 RepID=A0AAN8XRL6_HALRR
MAEVPPDSRDNLLSSGQKIPVSAMSELEHHGESSDVSILMGVEDNIYQGALTGNEECFVLLNDNNVRVMSHGSAVHLLSEQDVAENSIVEKTVLPMRMEGNKAVDIVDDNNKQSIEVVHMTDGRTLEVRPTEDGKSVELVPLEGEKTLEVLHTGAVKDTEVIHVDGSSSIELLSIGEASKSPTFSSSSNVYTKSKAKYILSSLSREYLASYDLKRSLSSETVQCNRTLNYGALDPVTSSIVITTPKTNLVHEHPFTPMPTVTSLVNSRQSQVVESNLNGLSRVTPSIIISHNKKVITDSVDSLDNAIIISWPPVPDKLENAVGTQTDPCESVGSSLNIFFCAFHTGGHAETLCDLPFLSSVGVSTDSTSPCGISTEEKQSSSDVSVRTGLASPENSASRFSRSGRPLKLKDSFLRSFSDDVYNNECYNTDLEGNYLNSSLENEEAASPEKKKRRRKRKKRYSSSDDFDLELIPCDIVEVKEEPILDVSIVPEEDPFIENDEVLALNVLKTKGYGLRTKRRLKKLNDMHYLEQKITKKKLEKSNKFACQSCSRVFPTFSRLQRHAKSEHNSTDFAFPCDQCGVVFTRPHNLDRHKETRHGDGEKRFVCEHCGSRFSRQDVLSVHISMVHFKKSLHGKTSTVVNGPSSLHCTGCDQFFSREQKLRNHREGDFTCTRCKLTFACKTSFRNHQYKNHPSSCSECGKVCKSRQQLYLHKLTHDPRHVCKFCHKGFLWKSQYTIHMSTHTGEKPLLCDICGKSFAHKIAVSKHKWQDHNDNNKKFKCPTCLKSFVYKAKLQSHMRSHTGEKPFMCQLCPSSFTQRCNLNAHIRSMHGVYIQSIKSDGTTQTQLVKYKRVKKTVPIEAQPSLETSVITQAVGTEVSEQPQIAIQEQVQMPESFETEAAVYQIVYAYPQ